MALTTNTQANAESIVNIATGQVVTDAGGAVDTTFQLGFAPRYVEWVNQTDRISLQWYDGMTGANVGSIRTVAVGTRTLDTTNYIAIGTGTVGTSSYNPSTFTIKATDIPASKVIAWVAFG